MVKRLFMTLFLIAALCRPVMGEGLPKNISIEVEFRETGGTVRKMSGLGEYSRIRESGYTKQHILVSDGLTGTIRVGEDVPYIEYYTRYFVDNELVTDVSIALRELGTALKVTPRIRGNLIEISLTPSISYVSDEGAGTIAIQELSTTVMAMSGQPISIGGLIKDSDFAGYFFSTSRSSSLDIVLTPRVK